MKTRLNAVKICKNNNIQRKTLRCLFIDNLKLLAISSVLLCIAVITGWFYWNSHDNDSIESLSSVWYKLSSEMTGVQASKLQLEVAQHFADTHDNNHGAIISMGLARQFVHYSNNLFSAEKNLQKALNQANEINLQSLIKLRLARVQLQQKKVDSALKTLDGVVGSGWVMLAEDIRGDAEAIKGNKQAARVAYTKALQFGAIQDLVHMKLNNLILQEESHEIQ